MTRLLGFSEVIVLLRAWSNARLALSEHRRIAGKDHNGFGSAKCGCWCYDTDTADCEDAEALVTAEFDAANDLVAILTYVG